MGELPNQQAPEYIASSAFDSLWNRRIFNFKGRDAGHCHTYSPNETFLPNQPGHFYGFLGDNTLNQSVHEFYGYHVYLHSSKVIVQGKFLIFDIVRLTFNESLDLDHLFQSKLFCFKILFSFLLMVVHELYSFVMFRLLTMVYFYQQFIIKLCKR